MEASANSCLDWPIMRCVQVFGAHETRKYLFNLTKGITKLNTLKATFAPHQNHLSKLAYLKRSKGVSCGQILTRSGKDRRLDCEKHLYHIIIRIQNNFNNQRSIIEKFSPHIIEIKTPVNNIPRQEEMDETQNQLYSQLSS